MAMVQRDRAHHQDPYKVSLLRDGRGREGQASPPDLCGQMRVVELEARETPEHGRQVGDK